MNDGGEDRGGSAVEQLQCSGKMHTKQMQVSRNTQETNGNQLN
jgi:hypothetical protein